MSLTPVTCRYGHALKVYLISLANAFHIFICEVEGALLRSFNSELYSKFARRFSGGHDCRNGTRRCTCGNPRAYYATKQATSTIPIVFTSGALAP